MKSGVLIFAYNNEHIDYIKMAEWSAKNIHRHLDLPVCLVSNKPIVSNSFEKVIVIDVNGVDVRHFSDYGETVTWYNGNRSDVYDITPWDKTLVLDADYVVASSQLKMLFDMNQDFIAHKTAYDITGLNDFTGLNNFGRHKMPMWWATVMLFQKNTTSKLIFDSMKMVRDNWRHYLNLYAISNDTYRNDYALSIALGIVNGHDINYPSIPWGLASLTPEHVLTQMDVDKYRVDFLTTDQKPKWIMINQDFHAMGKKHLGDIIVK